MLIVIAGRGSFKFCPRTAFLFFLLRLRGRDNTTLWPPSLHLQQQPPSRAFDNGVFLSIQDTYLRASLPSRLSISMNSGHSHMTSVEGKDPISDSRPSVYPISVSDSKHHMQPLPPHPSMPPIGMPPSHSHSQHYGIPPPLGGDPLNDLMDPGTEEFNPFSLNLLNTFDFSEGSEVDAELLELLGTVLTIQATLVQVRNSSSVALGLGV